MVVEVAVVGEVEEVGFLCDWTSSTFITFITFSTFFNQLSLNYPHSQQPPILQKIISNSIFYSVNIKKNIIYSVYCLNFKIKLLPYYTKVKNGFRCNLYACIIKRRFSAQNDLDPTNSWKKNVRGLCAPDVFSCQKSGYIATVAPSFRAAQ